MLNRGCWKRSPFFEQARLQLVNFTLSCNTSEIWIRDSSDCRLAPFSEKRSPRSSQCSDNFVRVDLISVRLVSTAGRGGHGVDGRRRCDNLSPTSRSQHSSSVSTRRVAPHSPTTTTPTEPWLRRLRSPRPTDLYLPTLFCILDRRHVALNNTPRSDSIKTFRSYFSWHDTSFLIARDKPCRSVASISRRRRQ